MITDQIPRLGYFVYVHGSETKMGACKSEMGKNLKSFSFIFKEY